MVKRTVPYGPGLKLRPERVRKAQELREDFKWLDDSFRLSTVELCIGSKRKNKKAITLKSIAQVHHFYTAPAIQTVAQISSAATYTVVELRDGRFVFVRVFGAVSTDEPARQLIVSHDLENLWWYGVPEVARKAMVST